MKTITITKYVAFDGSVFTNEKDCEEYEQNATSLTDILDTCRVIKSLEDFSPKFFGDKNMANTCTDLNILPDMTTKKYSWIYIENAEEFEKIRVALAHDLSNSHLVKCIRPPEDYPDVLVVEKSKSNSRSSINHFKFTGRYRYLHDEMSEFKAYKKYIQVELDKLLANSES